MHSAFGVDHALSKSAKKLGLKLARIASTSREPKSVNYLATRLTQGKNAARKLSEDTYPSSYTQIGEKFEGHLDPLKHRRELARGAKFDRELGYSDVNKPLPERGYRRGS